MNTRQYEGFLHSLVESFGTWVEIPVEKSRFCGLTSIARVVVFSWPQGGELHVGYQTAGGASPLDDDGVWVETHQGVGRFMAIPAEIPEMIRWVHGQYLKAYS